MAVRVSEGTALGVIPFGFDRIVEVSDDEIAEAIRTLYSATHNCAEGAGAAALAALLKEREQLRGRRVTVISVGQNIDRVWMQAVLAGHRKLADLINVRRGTTKQSSARRTVASQSAALSVSIGATIKTVPAW